MIKINIPTHCPSCNSLLCMDGEYLMCINTFECIKQIQGRIKNWIKELNILEWGTSLIDKLVESKKVITVADLYKLTIDDLTNIDRMGEKSAKKCFSTLWSNNKITLNVFLGALSIPMIGSTTIKQIMNTGWDTLEKFYQLDVSDFEKVPGVGTNKATFLVNGLIHNRKVILELLNNGIEIKNNIIGKLSRYKIAITGSTKIKRADLEKLITDNGGESKSSVGKTCTHLVINDVNSTSSKAIVAQKLGLKLISEDDLLSIL